MGDKNKPPTNKQSLSHGNVYVMTHSFFSDVIKIGCTPNDPIEHAAALSAKTPGEYKVVFSIACANPCQIKSQIRDYLHAKAYVNEFYQVPIEVAEKLLTRETLRIPSLQSN
ncbi:T5orf172 domain-containing protein [Colwellia chukchiensis]|uniref:T5orf172 domain-containing protein n=1 Tax=Colwellia chukchiensis TaxID=641665 RepID=A0A1H7Q9B2_9GAMM|nr:GIY-YIG nuclease family protein [Colwellia chukchiensis]SEL44741.1 T5orf172 domain-containing protein [Colwellia chukchiensis]